MFKILILVCVINAIRCDEPKVCYDLGCVEGRNFEGNLKPFEGFLGIPFAKPPVGDLRLRDPQPYTQRFNGTFMAKEEKMFCAQKNYLLPNPVVMGTEDCLYLYIYRPKNYKNRSRNLPVIIYIHGGAFFAGTAGPSVTGADYLMDTEDVIFVTMHYRLGPLGLLSTGDGQMSGNFGFKDQAMAIKWVKDRIHYFGGDTHNIALMGQSSGASSAHLHMMSKLSQNNFNKAILLSGNGNGPYAYVIKDPLQQARKYARESGIKNADNMTTEVLANELRKVDVNKLIDATDKFKVWSVDPLTVSRPVVEDCRRDRGFLCDDPVNLWRTGNYRKMPILTGFMDGDGAVRALGIVSNKTQLTDLNLKFDDLFPKIMELDALNNGDVNPAHTKLIKDRYLNGRNVISPSDVKSLIQLYTQRAFYTPMVNTLSQMLTNDRKSAGYLYKFNFKGRNSYSVFYTGSLTDYGIVHCDELIYLLKSPVLFPMEFEADSKEAAFRANFNKFITFFAAYGKPKKINDKTLQRCTKSEVSGGQPQLKCSFVDFSEKISVKYDGGINYKVVDFWNNIDGTLVV